MAIYLTHAQEARLKRLESDPLAKVVGVWVDMPIIFHSGVRKNGYEHLAVLGKSGRLRGLGKDQERRFRLLKRRTQRSFLYMTSLGI